MGNRVFTRWMEYTGDVIVTVYSGVAGKIDTEHGNTGDIFRSGTDPTADIIMTTNTKTETIALHYSYAYNWESDVFSKIEFVPCSFEGVGALTGPWTYNAQYNFGPYYSISTLEGMQVRFDLGEDINGWNFSDIDWERSFIGLDGYGETYKLCGIGYGPVQTITLPASDRYTDGYHHIYLMLFRRSYQEHAHIYYSNGFNAYVDTTEPGTLELGTLAKWDNYLGEYVEVSYDPSETIYLPTQQGTTYLSVDVLNPDGTPHEMQHVSDIENLGEVSVIAWNVAEPDKIVNLERAYLVEENGVISRSEEDTGTNSKRLLEFGLGTEDTDNRNHILGLALEQDSVIALQVRYANGRYSEITYLTVHPISIGKGGTATAIPFEIGDWPADVHYGGVVTADPGKAAVIFTPYEGENFTGLKVYCQQAYETHWAYDTFYSPYLYTQAFTPLPGTEPIELEQQADGTYVYYPEATDGKTTGIIRVADDGTVTNALADGKLAQGFYCFWAEDQYGNRDSMAITEYGVIADGAAPVVTEKSLTCEDGFYTATFKIYDDSLFTTFKSTNTWPVFDVDPPRPMTLSLSYDSAYSAAIGASDTLTLENVWNNFTWKNDEPNALGICEVTAELTQTGSFEAYDYGDTYDGFPTDAYLTVTVKGVISPKADNINMTLNLTATDAHGNVAEAVGVSDTVTGVQPAVVDASYRLTGENAGYENDRALYLTFNVPVQPQESWINRSIEGYATEWHDAFPIWKDGVWGITFTDIFGTIYTQSLTLDGVIGEYGFDLGFSTLDYVPASEGVSVYYAPDEDGEFVTLGGMYNSFTFNENGSEYIVREKGGETDALPIHLNNIVSGGPEETLYFYFDEFMEQYTAGSAEQYRGTTTGPVTVSYRTSRETSPVGETTLTFKNGESDAFTFQYYDAATDFTYTISGRLSDYGIQLAAPPEPFADTEAPVIDLVSIWKQHAGGFVQAEAFSGSADQATILAAIGQTGAAQSYDFVINASDYSKWKVVVKETEPTSMRYASATSDAIPGVSVSGNNVLVTKEVSADFYIVVVDNAKTDSAATADNFTCIRIPAGGYCFDTTAPVIQTKTVATSLYSQTVYIKATDTDDQGNDTSPGVTISGTGVLENTDSNAAEYPYKVVFADNDTIVVVTAVDAAGNRAAANLHGTGIDTTAPVLSVTWSPCFRDAVTGKLDSGNPTAGPVNTDVVAHITSDKPIVDVMATYTTYWGGRFQYDFNSGADWGYIDFTSQRVTVHFDYLYYDVALDLAVRAPNGQYTPIHLTLNAGVIDKEPPTIYVEEPEFLFREGYDIPYAAKLILRPTGEGAVMCTNYGPTGKLYYDDIDNPRYLEVTVTGSSEQVFMLTDLAGNLTRVVIPDSGMGFSPNVWNAPSADMLDWIDSTAPTIRVDFPDEADAEGGTATGTVTVSESCTLTPGDASVTCGALTQTTDSSGKTVWIATVTASKNGTFRLTATDEAGNEGTTVFTVHNLDKTLPVISFRPTSVNLRQGSSASELAALLGQGVTTWDNVEIKADSLTWDVSAVQLGKVGVYAVTYTVEDTSGNVGQAIRYVKVVDKDQPVVTIDGEMTEHNGVTNLEVGNHILQVGGLQAANEPYTVKLYRGICSAGQMKYVNGGIPLDASGSFTVESPGYYTIYIMTQSRHAYRIVLYVEN